ncbi:hypothetical protein MWH18_15840 [Acinetobacter pittii]|uniref:Uncharacterized protein n=2 Tax=Acinetobacter pittii TaxID=48296 RepID=A0AAE9S7Y9_ACIPI|nr:hypothetical protein [Acinetobacter pittii]USU93803.1 hypothetical protein MWH18_15840 [Acinetobacter pittii]
MCAHCISLGVQKMDVKDCLLVLGGLVRVVKKEPAMSEFKVGDHIVIDQKYDKTFMPVLQILSEGKNYFYCNDGQVHKSQMGQWRKAEPQEIAAGHRIDNDMGDDFPSPLCKSKDV